MANAILLIRPYKVGSNWVFDDERFGLVREPFVCGASELIDSMVTDLPDAEQGFNLLFSAAPFPGHQAEFHRTRAESGGTWYHNPATGAEGWLCPALFHYFPEAPEHIYAQAKP